jgi:hypothetical protein
MIAKLNPTLEECGVMTPRMKAMIVAKQRQQAQMIQQARKSRQFPLKVGGFGEPQN